MASICLNMIVRSEAAIIKRCLDFVTPYICAAVIVDTGSTDDTIRIMEETFAAANVPYRIHQREFKNFGQARNEALDLARTSDLDFDAILLTDADMELVVEDKTCFDNIRGPSYDIIQKAGALSYHNRRVVSRFSVGGYKGPTHEYIDIPAVRCLTGVHFVDHACGANRPDKFSRDIALLLEDLERDPANERSWFYLAQSYRDNGQPAQAAQAYRRRIDLGGWPEEVWNAMMNYAACLRTMGDEGGFIKETLEAYEFRPTRGETLFDLAKYYREKSQNRTSLLFSAAGKDMAYPNDALFVNDFVHKVGLREEFSICAFYVPEHKDEGFKVTNALTLDRESPDYSRELAKNNMYHYMRPLLEWAPSFKAAKIDFTPPRGYVAMNPSIANVDGELLVIVRTVNYVLTAEGRYLIRGMNAEATDTFPINTDNYLLQLNHRLWTITSEAITWDRPTPKFKPVTGLEDMRLFSNGGQRLYFSACVREQNVEGRCEQWFGRLRPKAGGPGMFVDDERAMRPDVVTHEKNWMPFGFGDNLNWEFVYRLGTVVNDTGKIVSSTTPATYTDTLSGGSQVIPFAGAYLCVVHEARHLANGARYYQHRFALVDEVGKLGKLSVPFYLHDKQIEFVAGLCWHPDKKRLLLSYGVRDEEAWIAEVDWQEVMGMLL